jgi:hypothetical protein
MTKLKLRFIIKIIFSKINSGSQPLGKFNCFKGTRKKRGEMRIVIELVLELFIVPFHDRGGIATVDMSGFSSEVAGENYAGEKNSQSKDKETLMINLGILSE